MDTQEYIKLYGQLKSGLVNGYVTDKDSIKGYNEDIEHIQNTLNGNAIKKIEYIANTKIFKIILENNTIFQCKIDPGTNIYDFSQYRVKDVKYNNKSLADTYGIVDLNKIFFNFVLKEDFQNLHNLVQAISKTIKSLSKVSYTGDYNDLKNTPEIVHNLGDSENSVISQKGVTEAIYNNKTFVTDIIDDTPASHNKAVSPKAVKDFVEEQFIDNVEIPEFKGILESANVVAEKGFNKNGEVYFIKTAIINSERRNNIFAYKIRNTYYQSWHNVYDYMTQDLSSPIDNKLFEHNKQQYLYSEEEFDLLTNAGKLKWKEF